MTKIRKTKKSNVAKGVEQLEFSYITGISTKWCNQEKLWQLHKCKHILKLQPNHFNPMYL